MNQIFDKIYKQYKGQNGAPDEYILQSRKHMQVEGIYGVNRLNDSGSEESATSVNADQEEELVKRGNVLKPVDKTL